MMHNHPDKKTDRKSGGSWTFRRIAALAGIILLLAMYGSTMVFAVIGSPETKTLLMASIYCTIAVPVLLYAITLTTRTLRGRGVNKEIQDAYKKVKEEQDKAEANAPVHSKSENNPSPKSS